MCQFHNCMEVPARYMQSERKQLARDKHKMKVMLPGNFKEISGRPTSLSLKTSKH